MAGLPDLVYVVGPGTSGHEELRYSLRSVAKNLPHRKVWIVGSVPAFIHNIEGLSLAPNPDKFENQRQSLTAAVRAPGVSDEFILMNDDMFVVESVLTSENALPCWHLGPTSEYIKFLASIGKNNDWFHAVRLTAEWFGGEPNCYEAHIPLLYSKERLRAVLTAYPTGRYFAAGGAYEAARAGAEGVLGVDSKVTNGPLEDRLHLPFLSSVDWSFKDGPIGQHIRQLFPEKCRYER